MAKPILAHGNISIPRLELMGSGPVSVSTVVIALYVLVLRFGWMGMLGFDGLIETTTMESSLCFYFPLSD